jgi:protein ImuA
MDRAALLAALRARIGRLDRSRGGGAGPGSRRIQEGVRLCGPIDRALPGGTGLARAAIHEVLATGPGAAAGFCALLLGRAARPMSLDPMASTSCGSLLWIAADPDAWPAGLAQFGISPADLVLVQARRPVDGLWAMEEALRCPAVAGALLMLTELDLTSARRLQLAAETGGALGLLLRPDDGRAAGATAALTRWRVSSMCGTGEGAQDLGDPRWRLELLRCRGGRPNAWTALWRSAAERLEIDPGEQSRAPQRQPRRSEAASTLRLRSVGAG